MNKSLVLLISLIMLLFGMTIKAQEDVKIAEDTLTRKVLVKTSQWIPLNAYSIAPGVNNDSVLVSAMPINFAFGISIGTHNDSFIRLSAIANWRIEYEAIEENDSFSFNKIGIGLMADYSEFFYIGVVYPIELMKMHINKPQVLFGLQIALVEN